MPALIRRPWWLVLVLGLTSCQTPPKQTQRPMPPPMLGKGEQPMPRQPLAQHQPPKQAAPQWTAPPANPQALQAPTKTEPKNDIVIRATAPSVPPDVPPLPPRPPVEDVPSLPKPPEELPPVTSLPQRPRNGEPTPTSNPAKLRELHTHAAAKYAGINDYIARFRRREVVNGKQQAEDLMEFKFRKAPFSVYFKWLKGTANEGREIIYIQGQYKNQMQVRSGKGDIISGFRTEVDPKSARATANSRRTIEDAGLGNLVDRFGTVLASHENGENTFGPLEYRGLQKRPESPTPMECVVQKVPAGLEKHLPRGGDRFWYFSTDEQTKVHQLPVLIVTHDETGREVEYYSYERVTVNVGLKAEEFDPNAVWGKK